jgi:hypothetical protein
MSGCLEKGLLAKLGSKIKESKFIIVGSKEISIAPPSVGKSVKSTLKKKTMGSPRVMFCVVGERDTLPVGSPMVGVEPPGFGEEINPEGPGG